MEVEKYLVLNKEALLFTTKTGNNILIRDTVGDRRNYRFFSVNNTGKQIIEKITGELRVSELVHKIVDDFEIDYEENKEWIKEYIDSLIIQGAAYLSDSPQKHNKIIDRGANDIISPMHVTIELTNKCNLRCKHCYVSAKSENSNMINFEEFRTIVDDLEKNFVVNIELTGGEIFVNPDAYQILEYAFKKFANVGILTNGVILQEKVLDLIAMNKDRAIVNVSIDSIHSEVHDEFRGMKGAFELTCKNVQKLTEKGIRVRIASSIFKDNMWEIHKLADLAIELKASFFSFNFVEEFGRGEKIFKDVYQDVNVENYYVYIKDVLEKYKNIIPIQSEESGLTGAKSCGAGVNSIVVDAEGNIRSCVLAPKWCNMGNIKENNFKDIMSMSIYKDISNIVHPNIKNGCDKDCKFVNYCKGCYIKAFQVCKNREEMCSWIKQNKLEEMYYLYAENKNENC